MAIYSWSNHNRLIQQVKTFYPPISRVCLFLGLLLILLGQVAEAQVGWSDEPGFPVTPSIISTGRWYITAGAKLRNLQSIRFNQILTQDDWLYNSTTGTWYQLTPTSGLSPGTTLPIDTVDRYGIGGPITPGPFGTGTGRIGFTGVLIPPLPADYKPNWAYDNGILQSEYRQCGSCNSPANDPLEPTRLCDQNYPYLPTAPKCITPIPSPTPPPPPVVQNTCADVFPNQLCDISTAGGRSNPMGHRTAYLPVSSCTTDATTGAKTCNLPVQTQSAFNIGRFTIDDIRGQSNGATPSQSTSVSYSRLLDTPIGLRVISNEFQDLQRPNSVWSPAFEVGVQFESFFSLFYGFSFYNVQQSYSRQSPIYQLNQINMSIQDTFQFWSSDTNNWSGPFDSPHTPTGSEADYLLYPNGEMNNTFPTRSFITVVNSNTTLQENVIEYINHNFSAFVFENRFGGTSSTPLYGYGNLGLSLGLVVNRIWYQVDATRRVAGQGPNYTGQNIINLFGGRSDSWVNIGGFIGSNFDVAFRNYFVKTSVDYAWCYYEKYLLMDTFQTEMNFGGWSFAISAGIRF